MSASFLVMGSRVRDQPRPGSPKAPPGSQRATPDTLLASARMRMHNATPGAGPQVADAEDLTERTAALACSPSTADPGLETGRSTHSQKNIPTGPRGASATSQSDASSVVSQGAPHLQALDEPAPAAQAARTHPSKPHREKTLCACGITLIRVPTWIGNERVLQLRHPPHTAANCKTVRARKLERQRTRRAKQNLKRARHATACGVCGRTTTDLAPTRVLARVGDVLACTDAHACIRTIIHNRRAFNREHDDSLRNDATAQEATA